VQKRASASLGKCLVSVEAGEGRKLWMIVNLVTFGTWRNTTRDE